MWPKWPENYRMYIFCDIVPGCAVFEWSVGSITNVEIVRRHLVWYRYGRTSFHPTITPLCSHRQQWKYFLGHLRQNILHHVTDILLVIDGMDYLLWDRNNNVAHKSVKNAWKWLREICIYTDLCHDSFKRLTPSLIIHPSSTLHFKYFSRNTSLSNWIKVFLSLYIS